MRPVAALPNASERAYPSTQFRSKVMILSPAAKSVTSGALCLFALIAIAIPGAAQDQTSQTKQNLLKNYGKIPLHFEPNVGQAAEQAKYISRGNGYAFFLTPSEAVLVLRQNGASKRHPAPGK